MTRTWKHGDHNAWYRKLCRCDICVAWYESTRKPRKPWTHGLTGYERHGCRCEICLAAKSECNRRSYEANREKRIRDAVKYKQRVTAIARREQEAAEAKARQDEVQRQWRELAGVRRPVPGLDVRLLNKPR